MMEHYDYDEDSRFDNCTTGTSGRYRTASGNFRGYRDSDEDTEDASETESMKPGDQEEFSAYSPNRTYFPEVDEMKEQCFRSRLAELHQQLAALEAGTHPAWISGLAKLQKTYEAQKFELNCHYEYTMERIQREFETEKRAAIAEFEERRLEIKEAMQADLDEQRRRFHERKHNDLIADAVEPKPVIRRQLRRRANDPGGPTGSERSSGRRRQNGGPTPSNMNFQLEESLVNEDMKQLEKIVAEAKREDNLSRKARAAAEQQHLVQQNGSASFNGSRGDDHSYHHSLVDARIEDGKLFYNKKWFHRGQNVLLESTADGSKQPGIIFQVGSSDMTIRRVSTDSSTSFKQPNMKVTVADLQARKYLVHRRS